ncbi:MAG: primosomal protein N' [Flammeovirgaceae bacterium]
MSSSRQTFFAEIILPVPIPKTFCYRVPFEMNQVVQVGKRVVVEFGKRRVLTGIVAQLHEIPPKDFQVKYILDVLDADEVTVNPTQLQFWNWVADYYLCYIGEVMQVALPSGLKITSSSHIQINPEFAFFKSEVNLTHQETDLLNAIDEANAVPYERVEEILKIENPYKVIKSLMQKRAILLIEEIKEKYKPKKIKKIRLNPTYVDSGMALEQLFDTIKGKFAQENLLLKYLTLVPLADLQEKNKEGVEKYKLLGKEGEENKGSVSALNTLIKHGVFVEFEVIVSRLDELDEYKTNEALAIVQLNLFQTQAFEQIIEQFKNKDTILLHGITGSGKTEIYIELIKRVLENNAQVLFMLPEIVLTAQMVNRLRKVFGNKLGVYHSKFSDNERVEVYKGVAAGKFSVIVGVRSSIFLPFDNLGLIVIDEEHEPSYKQYDPSPRYHARDAAIMLAKIHNAKVLLGSATPSVETFYLAQQQRYGFVRLNKRFGNASLPFMETADIAQARRQKAIKGDFTIKLLDAIQQTLLQEQQVILFQNKRGYANFLNCMECDWVAKCPNCAVSLTFHLYNNELRCHYCGHKEASPRFCPACGSSKIKSIGVGTEKIEDELKTLFPNARIQRMDLDTMRSRHAYQQLIYDFENKIIDILVGTQMVSKGLDFDNVGLVGVFDADKMLHFPDFRSYERTFQLIEQVSGRAGRRNKQGRVIIQTANPKQHTIQYVMNHDYDGFYKHEIQERRLFNYPPFVRLINLTFKHEDKTKVEKAAFEFSVKLKQIVPTTNVLGPKTPLIERIRNQYLIDILIKIPRSSTQLNALKKQIKEAVDFFLIEKEWKNLEIIIDVDSV